MDAQAETVFAWRIAGDALEDPRHVALVGEAGFGRDGCERLVGIRELTRDVLNARSNHCIGDRVTAKATIRATEVRGMYATGRRERREVKWALEFAANCRVCRR